MNASMTFCKHKQDGERGWEPERKSQDLNTESDGENFKEYIDFRPWGCFPVPGGRGVPD